MPFTTTEWEATGRALGNRLVKQIDLMEPLYNESIKDGPDTGFIDVMNFCKIQIEASSNVMQSIQTLPKTKQNDAIYTTAVACTQQIIAHKFGTK